MNKLDWIAVDWGNTYLRAYALDANNDVLFAGASEAGMSRLSAADFEPALIGLIGSHLPEDRVTPVLIAGMAGARGGWQETGYRAVPARPLPDETARVTTQSTLIDVRIVPGLSQRDPDDVMRGEETQIAGFLAGRPDFAGSICLPGTHSKWVKAADGQVLRFQTFLTGELFALLSKQSILRRSLGPGFDGSVFRAAVARVVAQPELFASALFSLRARDILSGNAPGAAASELSGLVIGLELSASAASWRDRPVVLIGAQDLCARYVMALDYLGSATECIDSETVTLKALGVLRRRIWSGAAS